MDHFEDFNLKSKTITVRFTDDALRVKSAVHVGYDTAWFSKKHALKLGVSMEEFSIGSSSVAKWKPLKVISELKDKIIAKLIKANEDLNLGE